MLIKRETVGRDEIIDLVKGLGIFCMVAGHCGAPFTEFIYLFHMAVFFMASGYCYREENSDSIRALIEFIKRKVKTLWFPYVFWTMIYSIFHNFFIRINIYTDNKRLLEYVSSKHIVITSYWTNSQVIKNILKSLLFGGGTELGGALWFLGTLMEITVLYSIIYYLIKKFSNIKNIVFLQTIVSIVFLCMGYICYLKNFHLGGIERILSFYSLYHVGYIFKLYQISNRVKKHIFVTLMDFIILYFLNKIGSIELVLNSYVNPMFLLIASCIGWQFLYEISFLIKNSSLVCLKKIILCMGKNTMPIVILHFLSFKFVNYIGVLYKREPLFLIAAFPNLYNGRGWWILYTFTGLVFPILINFFWKRFIRCNIVKM